MLGVNAPNSYVIGGTERNIMILIAQSWYFDATLVKSEKPERLSHEATSAHSTLFSNNMSVSV